MHQQLGRIDITYISGAPFLSQHSTPSLNLFFSNQKHSATDNPDTFSSRTQAQIICYSKLHSLFLCAWHILDHWGQNEYFTNTYKCILCKSLFTQQCNMMFTKTIAYVKKTIKKTFSVSVLKCGNQGCM